MALSANKTMTIDYRQSHTQIKAKQTGKKGIDE
jgi:hypothetical protein